MGSITEIEVQKLSLEQRARSGTPEQLPDTGVSVLIVGAGIGGLTCALECWRRGHQVRILERSKTENLLGDSLTVGPSAIAILQKHWPSLYEDFRKESYHPEICFHTITGEKILGPIEMSSMIEKSNDASAPLREFDRHNRPQLHQVLLVQIRRCNIVLEYNRKAVDYYEDLESCKGGVILEDGSRLEADLVVAADGVHTPSWKLVGGEKPPARPSGNSVYRTAFPVEHMLKDPELADYMQLQEGLGCAPLRMFMGAGTQFILWRDDKFFSWGVVHKDTGSATESWGKHVPASEVLSALTDELKVPISDLCRRAILCTPESATLVDWKLMFRDSQPIWCSPGGYVAQLGDSAHTFLPSSGNGATQAMEDATSLAACLALAARDTRSQGSKSAKANVPLAVRAHCAIRFHRVDSLQLFGFLNQFSRNKPDFEAIMKDPELVKMKISRWLVEHDAEVYAEESWAEIKRLVEEGRESEWVPTNVPKGYEYRKWTLDDMLAVGRGEKEVELVGDW